ncbi:MAG TPA: ECF-type sigma factor [Gemmataceae bacterium]|nr:ECF-type sigma factor [Gemmataceae bacterium]
MSSSGSVSVWIAELKNGDGLAAQRLWEGYFPRLVGLARKKLRAMPRRVTDEEDVALSAFDSFCRGANQGRFPRVTGRDDLWPLLVTITARKALQALRHQGRQKRGGGNVRGDSAFQAAPAGGQEEPGLEQVVGSEPTPEFAAQMAEECQRLLGQLSAGDLREVAVMKMEGYSNEEIAAKLGCVPRTIERKVALIRSLWEDYSPPA